MVEIWNQKNPISFFSCLCIVLFYETLHIYSTYNISDFTKLTEKILDIFFSINIKDYYINMEITKGKRGGREKEDLFLDELIIVEILRYLRYISNITNK